MPGVTDWTFGGTWPYRPRWVDSPDGRMHYIDEGPRGGRPVVLVHGNPTWGYLFRHFVAALDRAGHRAIVPDHLGFGRSAKPGNPDLYAVERHADRLEQLLDSLDLSDAVLVAHDWGGPIGLRWAARRPDQVSGLFVINTVAHPLAEAPLRIPPVLRPIRAPVLGPLLVQGLDALKTLMFRLALERREAITPMLRRAYRDVHPSWSERAGMLAFVRQLPTRPGAGVDLLNAEISEALALHFRSKPVRIFWGDRDLVLAPELIESAWLRSLPQAQVTRIGRAGHFVPEDAPEIVVPGLIEFVAGI